MASITKRGGSYFVQIRKKSHPPLHKSFKTKRAAQQWATQTEADINAGEIIDSSSYKLADAVDRYIENPDRRLTTYQRRVLKWWREDSANRKGAKLGTKKLAGLRRSDFNEARDLLRSMESRHGKRLAPSTINRRLSLVSAVLTEAMEWDWIKTNPARIRRLVENNERDRLLTEDERARLLEACKASDEPALYPLVVCAMLSGARASELQGLRWKDVDLDKGVARLTKTKNDTRRAIPMRGLALELLRDMKAAETVVDLKGDGFVFKNKTGFAPFYFRPAWGEARAAAKLDDVRFHDLRHLAASMLAMAGATQRELQEVLGHQSAQMTKRYSHFFDQHIAELGDRLQEKLFGGEK